MLKVLLVDDDPLIQKELSLLVNWKQEGFEIVRTLSGSRETCTFLKSHQVDLLIAGSSKPRTSGLALLQQISAETACPPQTIILSEHEDFQAARQAFRLNCIDFLTKPLQQQDLLDALHKVRSLYSGRPDAAPLSDVFVPVLHGKADAAELACAAKLVPESSSLRFVELVLADPQLGSLPAEEKRAVQKKVYARCREFLGDAGALAILDASARNHVYDVGIIYCSGLARTCSENAYLQQLFEYAGEGLPLRLKMLVGRECSSLASLSESYASTEELYGRQALYFGKDIFFYEEEMRSDGDHTVLCKEQLDELIYAINIDNHSRIHKSVDALFAKFRRMNISGTLLRLNIHYLMFNLIHLASEQNSELTQEEILQLVDENTFDTSTGSGDQAHIARFACDYADYLMQLHRQVPSSTLHKIAQEIKTNYSQNLTLKNLGKKYHINSAYLGQLYRKQYGCSFKDSLCRFRIAKSEEFLLKTDKCIYEIASLVGYRDPDYFVSLFISAKGCTPARFRKQQLRAR